MTSDNNIGSAAAAAPAKDEDVAAGVDVFEKLSLEEGDEKA